jgi:hypothetical protein
MMSATERAEAARLALIDDVRLALGEVFSGALTWEAENLIDHMRDRGLEVVRRD